MTQLLRFVTRTQLVRFRPFKPSLTTSIPPPLTVTLPQFSTKTSATRLRDRSPANDGQLTGFTPPTVCGKEFIHISEADTVAPAAAAPRAPKTSVGLDGNPVALAEELSRNVIHLSCESTAKGGVCDVFLVGTVHRNEESRRRVRGIVDFLKPEAVFLELCLSRVEVLTYKKKKFKIFGESEVFTSSEFGVAYEEAIKYGGRVILGDRPQEITSKRKRRSWKMLLSSFPKMLFYLPHFILYNFRDPNKEEMDDILTRNKKLSKVFPTLMVIIEGERDQYMSSTLLEVASESRSVVAVVGRGHLPGIKKNWKQPVVMEDLMTVTSPIPDISAMSLLTSAVLTVAVAFLTSAGLTVAVAFIISRL